MLIRLPTDDPARLQALARRQARQRMLDIRQRAEQFDQARREANAAAALLEMEGGNAATPGADVDMAGGLSNTDMDELNKTTGLKDRTFRFYDAYHQLGE